MLEMFNPDDAITREQLAAILWRYAKNKTYDVSVGEDERVLSHDDALAVSEYAVPAMQWAYARGVEWHDSKQTFAAGKSHSRTGRSHLSAVLPTGQRRLTP